MTYKNLILNLILVVSYLIISCEPKADHSVRIKNNSQATLVDVKIGPAVFGTISVGTTTDYKSVPEGKLTMTGNIKVNGGVAPMSNDFGVHGNGKHKYTYTLDNQLSPQLTED